MRKKIAIVNQRYGVEVNGGSEYYTRMLAEHLQNDYEVEVLTTTALDYDTWAPYYPAGVQKVNQINVRRFDVAKQRNIKYFSLVDRLIRNLPWFRRCLEPLWVRAQGPYCPELIHYIKEHKEEFDVFIFVTYLYYTSLAGIPEVKEKVVFVPTAHDEYCIYFHAYRKLFEGIKGIVYLTGEEKSFVQQLYHNEDTLNCIAGSGVELPKFIDTETMEKNYNLPTNYVIYVGRVDIGKDCDELFDFFSRYIDETQKETELIVIGKMMMAKPENDRIRILGFISEEDKYGIMAGAKVLIMPSRHESLSLVLLESMAMGVPVLANGSCSVLEGHCRKSKAGISYQNYEEFKEGLEKLLDGDMNYYQMQDAGKYYVKENYNWDKTVGKYRELIEG